MNNNKKYIILGGLIFFYYVFKKDKSNNNVIVPIKPNKKNKLTEKQINFIKSIAPAAKEIEQKIGVPYQFIIAQICNESAFGRSSLTTKYFNYGGIKAVKGQKSVNMLTTECYNGKCSKVYRDFAVFNDAYEGLMAQAKIYSNRYFKQYLNKTTNPYEYVKLLQSGKVKYATSLTYVKTISNFIDLVIKAGF